MDSKQFQSEFGPLIEQLQRIQKACGFSDRKIVARYRQLRSTKTWRQRLIEGDLSGLNLDKLAGDMRALQVELSGGTPVEHYLKDLPFAEAMDIKLARLEGQTNDRRILVCLASTGTGKSTWARWAVEEDRASRTYVRCRPTWREKKIHLCAAIARALGEGPATTGQADAEEKVISLLKAMPRTVIVDEAHEGGVALMKLVRTFVDETAARFVYLAYPTEFDRVRTATSGSLVEAQQFIGRCLKPIFDDYASGTTLKDLVHYLKAEADLGTEAKAVAETILPTIRRGFNLRIVADAIEEARAAADGEAGGRELIDAVHGLARVRKDISTQ